MNISTFTNLSKPYTIIWVKALNKYVNLYTTDEVPLLITRSRNNVEVALPKSLFVRIHKSHIINLKHLKSINGYMVTLTSGVTLNIGPNYKETLMSRLNVL